MRALHFFLGRFIGEILNEAGGEPVETFNSILLWYIAIDLFLRCLMQPLPTLQVTPYLRFRISRLKIISFLLFRSFWNLFSLIPWLVFIPFAVKILLPIYGIGSTITYILGILLLIILNNYLAVLIGFIVKKNVTYLLVPISIVALFPIFQKLHLPVRDISITTGLYLVQGNLVLFGILLATIFIILISTCRLLLSNFYIDEIAPPGNGNFHPR